WDRIEDRWDLRRYFAMHRHWREFGPPTYVAVAMYLGLNRPRRTSSGLEGPDDLAQFLANLPGAVRAPAAQD
ncbi:MAG: hypothetical protein P4M09_07920, partial [Devosia sp.]|nr:hypothetical protein [Devosia sp.]